MNPRYDRHITSPEWYALKDRIRARALGRCEWCRLRPMALLHHRSYAHVGAEPEADVMGVCHACHKAIHGHIPSVMVQPGSLAARGDRGAGRSELWDAYLQTCTGQQAAATLTHLSGCAARAPSWAACGNPYASGCTRSPAHVTCPACLQVAAGTQQEVTHG